LAHRCRRGAVHPISKYMLGSHRFIAARLDAAGTPLSPLPFRGAVYRVGHAGAHSGSRNILSQFVLNLRALRRPWESLLNLTRVGIMTQALRDEFFGDAAPAAAAASK